jgi:hypothetical protein
MSKEQSLDSLSRHTTLWRSERMTGQLPVIGSRVSSWEIPPSATPWNLVHTKYFLPLAAKSTRMPSGPEMFRMTKRIPRGVHLF